MEPMHIWDYGRMSVGRHYVGKFDFDCSKNAGYAPLRKSYFAALELVNEFANRKKEIDADKNLTKEGKADAARKWLASRGTDLDAGRAAVERARSDLEMKRRSILSPEFDYEAEADRIISEMPGDEDFSAAMLRVVNDKTEAA